MMKAALFWLLFDFITVLVLAFYSMTEMACVSFNKVRLNYYVQKDIKKAIRLNWLLHHPFRLFGTTLIGVNLATVIGSECARQFYSSMNLNPNLAPLTQVVIVVIFGELAPMFAARHYAEHVAMQGALPLWLSAKILSPLLVIVGWITNFTSFVFGAQKQKNTLLNLEELKKILEERGDEITSSEAHSFNVITDNIFLLRHKRARDTLIPLSHFPVISSNTTISDAKELFKRENAYIAAIYYRDHSNIVGIVTPKELLKASSEAKRARDLSKAPWFVAANAKLATILEQFKRNDEHAAIILDSDGRAIGWITLNALIAEIFGDVEYVKIGEVSGFVLERTFPGDMSVKDFNEEFQVKLAAETDLSLSDLMKKNLGRLPEQGETVYLQPFELTAAETSLLEVKKVLIRTKRH